MTDFIHSAWNKTSLCVEGVGISAYPEISLVNIEGPAEKPAAGLWCRPRAKSLKVTRLESNWSQSSEQRRFLEGDKVNGFFKLVSWVLCVWGVMIGPEEDQTSEEFSV